MFLTPGARLGAYEVLSAIGQGGMGEVWRARDTRLGRSVALKILPEQFATDPDRLARFKREAQVLASLNHPNIGGIYGLEESNGVQALVLELVEGPTLADRIAQGPIPLDEALPIARQIAEALEAAHEQGIVHRDLKPANVKVRPDGTVKVLDFGLAKALEPAGAVPPGVTQSPTITSLGMTGIGVLLGTAAYMSPEQARGKAVDKRTDIWAFGCVLYEMLTGRQAFQGDTVADVLAAVVGIEPAWQALPDSTPLAIGHLMRRCLQKDSSRRFHHIADARIEIEDAIATPSTTSDVMAAKRSWTGLVPWAVATLMTLTTLVVLLTSWPNQPPIENGRITRLELNLPDGVELMSGSNAALAMSSDGQRVAFVGMQNGLRRTYIRQLDELETRAVEGTEGAVSCFFSPDGRSLGIVTNAQQIKTVSLADGLVTTIATGADVLLGAAWAPSDEIVYVHNATLWAVPAVGGAAKQLTTLDDKRREVAHMSPVVLPAGNGIMFTVQTEGGLASHIDALVVATGARKTLAERAEGPLYATSGDLVFFRDGDLVAQPFDADRMTITGSPVRLPERIQGSTLQAASPLAVSTTGSLVYRATSQADTRLVWVSRHGVEEQLTNPPGRYLQPRLSPDGRYLAVWLDDELRIQDLVRGTFERVTGAERGGYPVWMPDEKRIAFLDFRSRIRWIGINGDGNEGVVGGTTASDLLSSVSPDGQVLVFLRFGPDSSGDIFVTSLREGSRPRPLVKTPAYEGGARFSPDGKWLAYVSDESGRAQVYVRPFPGPDRKWPVSTAGGTQPAWSRNGKELYYREGDTLMAVQVSAGLEPSFSQPTALFQGAYAFGPTIGVANYDVAPDGQRFVMIKEAPGNRRLTVVLNWSEELRRLVPAE